MSHLKQELEPVVFNKAKHRHVGKKKVTGDTTLIKIENGEIKIPRTTKEIVDTIRDARTSKNLTQKELAQKAGLPETDISAYEKVDTIIDNGKLQKIRKALNISIKKPKLEKRSEE